MTKKDKKHEHEADIQVPETEPAAVAGEAEETAAEAVADTDALAELENRYLRLMAEYDNFRKRSQKEKSRLYEDACIDVVAKLLPLIDSLDRSAELAAEVSGEGKAFAEGIPLMAEQAVSLLNAMKVQRIDALNEPFDPELHHALQQIEKEGVASHTVVDVLQTGYRLGDRLIRPALVIVSA